MAILGRKTWFLGFLKILITSNQDVWFFSKSISSVVFHDSPLIFLGSLNNTMRLTISWMLLSNCPPPPWFYVHGKRQKCDMWHFLGVTFFVAYLLYFHNCNGEQTLICSDFSVCCALFRNFGVILWSGSGATIFQKGLFIPKTSDIYILKAKICPKFSKLVERSKTFPTVFGGGTS